jgi:hypothetical protein
MKIKSTLFNDIFLLFLKGTSPSFETLSIDITDRNPNDHPSGIIYELQGDTPIPFINTNDFTSIFEEKTIIRFV